MKRNYGSNMRCETLRGHDRLHRNVQANNRSENEARRIECPS